MSFSFWLTFSGDAPPQWQQKLNHRPTNGAHDNPINQFWTKSARDESVLHLLKCLNLAHLPFEAKMKVQTEIKTFLEPPVASESKQNIYQLEA